MVCNFVQWMNQAQRTIATRMTASSLVPLPLINISFNLVAWSVAGCCQIQCRQTGKAKRSYLQHSRNQL
eukprot:1367818-Amphidinium_carterae.1